MSDYNRLGFAPTVPSTRPCAARAFRMFEATPDATLRYRAFDQGGTAQFVSWTANTLSPSVTTPQFTGTLVDIHIEVA